MIDYKGIFIKAENSLKKYSCFSEIQFASNYGKYKLFENRVQIDQEIYRLLVMIIFYSGFRASTVELKDLMILLL